MTYEPPGGPPPPPQPPWQPPTAGAPYPASAYGTPTGYGYAPAAGQMKPLKGLSTAVVVLLILTGLVSLWAAIALFHRASVVNDFSIFNITEVNDADSQVSGSVGLLQLGLVATGVLWIIWQFRFAKNAQALRGNFGLAPGWAIGGWFIPAGNLVLPQLQLLQAVKASDPDLPAGQPATSGRAPGSVTAWWVAYDLAGLLFGIGAVMRPGKNEILGSVDRLDRFVRADRVMGFSCLLYIVAAVIAILMVRAISDRQTRAMASAAPYPQGYQQPYPAQQQWQPPPPVAPPPPAPPQTWATPPPNQTWQPPPPSAPPPT